jgi:hypothetical protein
MVNHGETGGGASGSVVIKALVTNRKVAGSTPDEVNDFYPFT